ncbi:hypothetical protein ACQCSJ_22730, partial [Ralstonia pseudosolanacearum]
TVIGGSACPPAMIRTLNALGVEGIHPEHPSLLMIGEAFAGRAASAAPAQCPGAPHVLAA